MVEGTRNLLQESVALRVFYLFICSTAILQTWFSYQIKGMIYKINIFFNSSVHHTWHHRYTEDGSNRNSVVLGIIRACLPVPRRHY